jgi:glycosyltransferase involved in cell wall biosynthesis
MTDAISVIIPVFNAAPYVRQAVESALAQPETGEVVLVEDGSTDGSLDVCRDLAATDGRVRLYRHAGGVNRGCSASRNLAVEKARLDLVAFLDADDFYLPGRFHLAAAILEGERDVDGVHEAIGTHCEDDASRAQADARGEGDLTGMWQAVPPEALLEALLAGDKGWFSGDGLTVRRSIFERSGGFDVRLELSEDMAMWIKMSAVGRLVSGELRRPVAMRRLHPGNRITKSQDRLACFHMIMARTLFAWARDRQLDAGKQNLLLRFLLLKSRWADGGMPWRARKARLAARTLGLAIAHPGVVRLPYWSESLRENLRDALGIQGGLRDGPGKASA